MDGLSASGKGTIGKIISNHLNFQYLDTGLLYRAVAHKFLTSKSTVSVDKAIFFAKAIKLEDLDNPELRSENCGNLASKLAEITSLRQELILFQRNFPLKKNGCRFRRKRYRECYLP